MELRVLISAALVALALSGCGQQSAAPPPPGPVASGTPCDTMNHSSADPKRCVVNVSATVTNGVCTVTVVDPEPLVLKGHGFARVVWKLDSDFRFCATLGDGAFLKALDADAQFQDPVATDQSNGDPDPRWGQCKKHFRIDDLNASNNAYDYRLQFHTKDGKTPCQKDPQIRNG